MLEYDWLLKALIYGLIGCFRSKLSDLTCLICNWTGRIRQLPYLPLYNARLCIIRTPILDGTLKKKKTENRGSGYEKIA